MTKSQPPAKAHAVHFLLAGANVAQLPPLAMFAWHAWTNSFTGLLTVTAVAMALALAGAWSAWRKLGWTGWPSTMALSWTATVGFWGVCDAHQPAWWATILISAAACALVLFTPASRLPRVTWPVRVFCLSVISLTGYVTFWGLFFPTGLGMEWPGFAQGFNDGMPFKLEIPPLHARFIGSLYLGASVICASHLCVRRWSVGWLLQAEIFLWTFILMVVTARHLEAFRWEVSSVWFWFVAYLAFPAISLWIWQRIEFEPEANVSPLPKWARGWLWLQGLALLALSLLGFFAAPMLIHIWPWKLPEILSHIYSAPFATFGLGSCWAATALGERRRAVAPFCAGTTAIAVGALAASMIHRDKFNFDAVNAWVWFAALACLAAVNAVLVIQVLFTTRETKTT